MKTNDTYLSRKLYLPLMLGLLTMVLGGCVSHSIGLDFDATKNLNPDVNQQSLPVQVKIIQLKNALAFRSAQFDDLWEQPKQSLGASYLEEKNVVVLPNSRKQVTLTMSSDASFIGFVAIFRNRVGDSWRVIEPVPHSYLLYPKFEIQLTGHTIRVKKVDF